MKIVDYLTVSGSNSKAKHLRNNVCSYLDQGWQPYGYPYLDRNGTEKQAMVKYEEEIKSPFQHDRDSGIHIALDSKPETKAKKKGAKKNED